MSVTINKLDYIYKKLLHKVKSKMNDTVEISDEELAELNLNNIEIEENNDEDIEYAELPIYSGFTINNQFVNANENIIIEYDDIDDKDINISVIESKSGNLLNNIEYIFEFEQYEITDRNEEYNQYDYYIPDNHNTENKFLKTYTYTNNYKFNPLILINNHDLNGLESSGCLFKIKFQAKIKYSDIGKNKIYNINGFRYISFDTYGIIEGEFTLVIPEEPIVNPVNKYCNLPARLYIENIQQAPVLYNCCETSGEFCSITSDEQHFLFTNAASHTSTINATAIVAYNTPYLGLSGFIVGHSNIPESGEDITRVICYDRACPNCHKDYNITNPLVLQIDGTCKCNNCGRIYDLNDVGNIKEGQEGISLYRYRCSYLGNSLVINNSINNININISLPIYTESTTPVSIKNDAKNGIEIPSLISGPADSLIVHTLHDGTVNYCVGYNSTLKANAWTAFKWYNGFSSNNKVWNRSNWRNGETFNGYGGTGDPFQPDPVLPEAQSRCTYPEERRYSSLRRSGRIL